MTNSCPICLIPIQENDKKTLRVGCCGKTYCASCLLRWISDNETCPLCRFIIIDNRVVVTLRNAEEDEVQSYTEDNLMIACGEVFTILVIGVFTACICILFMSLSQS